MDAAEEKRLIEHVVTRLAAKHPQVSAETVIAAVADAHAKFDGRRIRDFVPLFVERKAKEQLSAVVSSG